jgi:hypothetical protein
MGFARVRGTLTSRVGRKVNYSQPKDVAVVGGSSMSGIIVDEVWADDAINLSPPRDRRGTDDWGDYSFCAQLIRWDSGEHMIRLAYYRRRPGENHWEFASQTTVTTHSAILKKLFERTLDKDAWFVDPGSASQR